MKYDSNLPLEERKVLLERITKDLEETYFLTRRELVDCIIPTGLITDDTLTIDLIIHILDLYQTNTSNEILKEIVAPYLQDNPSYVEQYKSGNTKVKNSILGSVLKTNKSLNPKSLMLVIEELLEEHS